MECLNDPEEKIMCPYNAAHFIRRSKMNGHLVKCKKNYCQPIVMVECDFNATHKIPEPELQYHHMNCPDRENIEITLYEEEGSDLNRFPIKPISATHDIIEESWDNVNVISYNPKEHLEGKNVIRHLDVAPPSERIQFRLNERRRLTELEQLEKARRMRNQELPPAAPSSLRNVEKEPIRKQEKPKSEEVFTTSSSSDEFIQPKSRKNSRKGKSNSEGPIKPEIVPPQTEVTPETIQKILQRIKIDSKRTASQ